MVAEAVVVDGWLVWRGRSGAVGGGNRVSLARMHFHCGVLPVVCPVLQLVQVVHLRGGEYVSTGD